MRRFLWLALLLPFLGALPARYYVQDASSRAFGHPLPGLSPEALEAFRRGDRAFNRVFVREDGLGPLFVHQSCAGCHVRDGRGRLAFAERSEALVRARAPDGITPHPRFGVQLQDHALPGYLPEGQVLLHWEEVEGRYPDGTPYRLRRPRLSVLDPAGRPVPGRYSLRLAPPVFGGGLLEAVPESALLALEDPADQDGDGVSGRVAHLPGGGVGRFGWKAGTASLREQTALAYREDMGLSTPLFPDEGGVEVGEEELEAVVFYLQHLAVPAPRHGPEALKGRRLFAQIGCAACHRPNLAGLPAYTDLLLHDMGPGLDDGVAEGDTAPSEWRTPPLWGIGLTRKVLGEERYLHDGRARSLEEAILWHGGEAEGARQRFMALSKEDRAALLRFLQGL
ncbi:thiol oxidoreductase with 2 cytochrome C heme-binding sites [Thermus sp. 2.9]|uniref:di-heme oxidoredictase family protein n=1 Tax=Thermus sp. (strain 2.9) TaxID=1577051 RepID=UPI00054360BB|nr:di-heme oxidoredictase family protein [Thermus sp. 2.9]KHG64463.1 thiol oxidoreductase with 2 cytochrome C heme-binding sites [Thermus sp. 2.9]